MIIPYLVDLPGLEYDRLLQSGSTRAIPQATSDFNAIIQVAQRYLARLCDSFNPSCMYLHHAAAQLSI